jgi:hypothetical protein
MCLQSIAARSASIAPISVDWGANEASSKRRRVGVGWKLGFPRTLRRLTDSRHNSFNLQLRLAAILQWRAICASSEVDVSSMQCTISAPKIPEAMIEVILFEGLLLSSSPVLTTGLGREGRPATQFFCSAEGTVRERVDNRLVKRHTPRKWPRTRLRNSIRHCRNSMGSAAERISFHSMQFWINTRQSKISLGPCFFRS